MKKICVITGNRAEYGILSPLLSKIKESSELELYLIVTGSHLSHEYGYSVEDIKKEHVVYKEIESSTSSYTIVGSCKSMALISISFSEVLKELQPDLLLVLGDRFEIAAAVNVANLFSIPIAHLHGGEITEGAFDDSIRHAITKMSHLHFTATQLARDRVIQMGEQPHNTHHVGSLGVEQTLKLKLLTKIKLEQLIDLSIDSNALLITYHPETNHLKSVQHDFEQVLASLNKIPNQIIFTKANNDPMGKVINQMIDDFTNKNKQRVFNFIHLGTLKYFSLIKQVKAVLGNSSSGIIEVPSFKIPSVDIGNRQKGRERATSVIHSPPLSSSLDSAIQKACSDSFTQSIKNSNNPYARADSCEQILKILHHVDFKSLIPKSFYHTSN